MNKSLSLFLLFGAACSGGSALKTQTTAGGPAPCGFHTCYLISTSDIQERAAITLAANTVGPHEAAGGIPAYSLGYCAVTGSDAGTISVGCSLHGWATLEKWLKGRGYSVGQ